MHEIIYDDEKIDNSLPEFPSQIRGIIADLRNVIDQLDSNFKSTKELIIELAKRLDEEKISERSKISRLIKYILKDKIRQGKITARWIEENLPDDYKRNYVKSEENSHLKKTKKLQKMLVDNRGKVQAESVSPNSSGKENQSMVQKDQAKDVGVGGCMRCLELEEALRKTSQLQTASDMVEREIRITVSIDKYQELQSVIKQCRSIFHIVVDKKTWSLVQAELDYADLI